MILGFAQFLYLDVLFDVVPGEGLLEEFEVFDELVLTLGLPLHLGKGKRGRVDRVNNLAVDSPSGALLHLGEL